MLKSESVPRPAFFVFLRIPLPSQRLLLLARNFRIPSSVSCGKHCCNFDWDCLESRDSLLWYGRFKCLDASIPRSWNLLLSPCVFLNFFPPTLVSFPLPWFSHVLLSFFIEISSFSLACSFSLFLFSFSFSILCNCESVLFWQKCIAELTSAGDRKSVV